MEEIVVSLLESMSAGLILTLCLCFLFSIPVALMAIYIFIKTHDAIMKLNDKLNAKNDSVVESGNKTKTDSDKEQLM